MGNSDSLLQRKGIRGSNINTKVCAHCTGAILHTDYRRLKHVQGVSHFALTPYFYECLSPLLRKCAIIKVILYFQIITKDKKYGLSEQISLK